MKFSAFVPRSLGEVGSIFKTAVIFFIIFFVFALLFKLPSYAQGSLQSNYTQAAYTIPNTNPDVPKNLHTLAQSILIDVLSSISCQLTGIDPVNPKQKCLGIDQTTGRIGFVEKNGGVGGVLGIMSSGITMLFTPPIHTGDYFKYLAGNFGITKHAYAQSAGVGYFSIAPISNVWLAFRNIVYSLFVLVFILIGFGIMLRAKIDPRTVMTIQNQIPKIIIALILITLSFGIAGFLIDIMWVVILVVINILGPFIPDMGTAGHIVTPNTVNYSTTFGLLNIIPHTSVGMGGMFSIMSNVSTYVGGSIFSAGFTKDNVNGLINLGATGCSGLDIACYLGGILTGVLSAILGFFIGIIVGVFAFFVIAIALIYAMFKLWFELLKAYVAILVGIVFAPFWIVAGLVPGGGEKVGFGAWVRDMLGNLMAFPTAIAIFLLAAVFTVQFKATSGQFFLPPLIGPQDPNIGPVIAFGLLMTSPNVVKMTKAIFKSGGLGFGPTGGGLAMAGAGMIGGQVKNRLYYRNPNDGSTHGALASAGRNVSERVSTSGLGTRAGNATLPLRTNRIARALWEPHNRAWYDMEIKTGSDRRTAYDNSKKAPKPSP